MQRKEFTQEELLIIWLNRFKKNSKQMTELIPDRTPKSIKHVLWRFKRITEEDEVFMQEQALHMTAKEIDEERNLPITTSSSYFRMKGMDYLLRPESYTKTELDTFHKHKGTKTYKEIAEMLGVSEKRIIQMAYILGVKTKFVWTEDKVTDVVSRLDRGETIEDVAKYYGRKRQAILVLLRKEELYDYIPESYSSKYTASKPELYIMARIEEEFGVSFPKKCRENAAYYWNIIPPYEVDIPFYIDGEKFAIEYNAAHWHSEEINKERDKEKKELLIQKGFHYFCITSTMHKHNNMKSMDPVLDKLCESVRNILKTKKRSTTIESIPEPAQGRSE